MPRPRIPLDQQKGHLMTNFKEERAIEEDLADVGNAQIVSERPPRELINTAAKKEWKRAIELLRQMKAIGDLDRSNLIGYCNAWAMYCEKIKRLNDPIITSAEKRELELAILKHGKEYREFGKLCCMDPSSRLKAAATQTQKKSEEIEEVFGDI